jgi:hypothetical protein
MIWLVMEQVVKAVGDGVQNDKHSHVVALNGGEGGGCLAMKCIFSEAGGYYLGGLGARIALVA